MQHVGLAGQASIYGRRKTNNEYAIIYNQLHGNHMARFKHEAYVYSLEKAHTAFKSIYIYHGFIRIAKASMPVGTPYLEIDFAHPSQAEDWDAASEQINTVHLQIPWVYKDFALKWNSVPSDNICKRVYKKSRQQDT